jgi:hypothetical protein
MSSQENVDPSPEIQPPPAQAVEKDRVAGKPKLNVIVREATEADLEDIVSRNTPPAIMLPTLHTTTRSSDNPETMPHDG